jgi:phosphatidylinositol alpha-1,6-mannosyltransferase
VRFLGELPDAARDRWLRSARVFAMPSRLPGAGSAGEGFGIVYLEAGAHGVPVVAGDVGGAVDAVAHGSTGLLVDPTDPLAVADAIVSLLQDPARAAEFGDAGRTRAREFEWDRIGARVHALLSDLAA